jgi:dipeptidase E
MCSFVIIGGGEIRNRETDIIDEHIVKLANKKNPRFLFIPTASNDSEQYIESIEKTYNGIFGCYCEHLCISKNKISESEIEKMIQYAEIIYVGGGNTKYLLEKWNEHKIDILLREKMKTDSVLCGMSAGAMCWFESGITDSASFTDTNNWYYSKLTTLGFIKGCHSPHYDEREKEEKFIKYIINTDICFLGIENNCAIEITNGEYKVIRAQPDKNAFLVESKNGTIKKARVKDYGKYTDIII